MSTTNFRYIFLLLLIAVIGCAKRGNIEGGSKDTLSPVLKMSFPKNFSTNFKGSLIKLEFDEYIKLKDINKQLIVSPPMTSAPEITPTSASKYINIKIKDTLLPNTTYSFNFGQSIQDNNEGNPYPQFKYVFSTGSYIDSLTLRGVVKDAYKKEVESFISVMLYEANEAYNDSIIYKKPPRYITNTLDSLKSFELENIKEGKYFIVAMKDYNSNNKFDPKTDKIAFHSAPISIPNDTLYEMELFQEKLAFKAFKPSQASGNKLILGYEGNSKGIETILKNGSEVLPTVITKVPEKDSVHIWYKPIKVDSLQLSVKKDNFDQNFTLRIKDQKKDSLTFSAKRSGILPLRENFVITASRPLVKFDHSLMTLTNKDSLAIPFKTAYNDFNQELTFEFAKEPIQKYKLTLLPGALIDFFDKPNDTLAYGFATKNTSDYGNLRITLQNVKKFPIIVELTDAKGGVVASEYSESVTTIDFNALEPALYTLRIIYDENANKIWDTGNFLKKLQPEQVIYFPTPIDVRANWDDDRTFTLP